MSAGKLKHPYITVRKEGKLSYGGSQSWSSHTIMKKYGCGAIAGTDLLLYLGLHKDYCKTGKTDIQKPENGLLEFENYMETAERMRHRYFGLIPGFGMPGWMLAAGINRYFQKNRIPLKASFGVTGRNLPNRIQTMLSHDIPVILSIGPNFPVPIKKYKLTFYRKKGENYQEACRTAAHYVMVTGVEGQWMRISSWGQEYYIKTEEYLDYVRRHSNFVVSNICYIRKRRIR